MINDDIYDREIEFKTKNEIIEKQRNYNNINKRMWTYKYVHELYAYGKNNVGYVNVGSFPQWIWCHCKLRKCVDE